MKMKDLAVGRGAETFYLDPDIIIEDESYNCRDMESEETKAHVQQMFEALKAGGVASFPPISVYKDSDDKIHLVVGHCRVRAFRMAKAAGVPIKGILAVANNMSEEERTLDLLNSNSGLALKPLEKAKVIQRLQSYGWIPAEIARRVGTSLVAVLDLIKLLEAPAELKAAVADGTVSATLVTDSVKAGTTENLKTAVNAAKSEGRIRVTQKNVEVGPKTGIQLYVRKVKGKKDMFVEDVTDAEFLFPCGSCSYRKDLDTCLKCVHNEEESEE